MCRSLCPAAPPQRGAPSASAPTPRYARALQCSPSQGTPPCPSAGRPAPPLLGTAWTSPLSSPHPPPPSTTASSASTPDDEATPCNRQSGPLLRRPPPPPWEWRGSGGSAGGAVAMGHRGVWGRRHFDGAAEGGPGEVVRQWPLSSAFLRPFLFGFLLGRGPRGPGGGLLFRLGPCEARPPLLRGRHPRGPRAVRRCGAGAAPVHPRGRSVSWGGPRPHVPSGPRLPVAHMCTAAVHRPLHHNTHPTPLHFGGGGLCTRAFSPGP